MAKSKYALKEVQTLSVTLTRADGPYLVVASTFEPQQLGAYTLTLTAPDDPAVRLEPVPTPGAPTPAPAPAPARAPAPAPAPAPAAVVAPVLAPAAPVVAPAAPLAPLSRAASAVNASPAKPTPAPAAKPLAPPAKLAAAGAAPSNEPVLSVEGQGLSERAQKEAAAAVSAALAACAGGKLYEDAEFPAAAASLGGGGWAHQGAVASWRRPSEVAGAGAVLLRDDLHGVRLGPINDRWLLGALNIIAGDPDVVRSAFVDDSHGANGFYVVRFYHDDPASDDDWQCVLVDDRLPCGADGAPAFAKCADPSVFWVAIVEKAAAKLFGSYEKLEAAPSAAATLQGLELVIGAKGKVVEVGKQGIDQAVWEGILEAQRTGHVVGARCDEGAPGAAAAQSLGIIPGRAYSVLTAGQMPCGMMVRMRGFAEDPEWSGKWSDGDGAWTNQLRQMLNYRDASDGTHWDAPRTHTAGGARPPPPPLHLPLLLPPQAPSGSALRTSAFTSPTSPSCAAPTTAGAAPSCARAGRTSRRAARRSTARGATTTSGC